MRASRRISALLGASALAMGLSLIPTNAQAANIVGCSENALVAAIDAANMTGGDDLVLAPFCTYNLTAAHSADGASGLPDITTPITLTGAFTDIVRSPSATTDFRILKVDGSGTNSGDLKLSSVTLRGGKAPAGQSGGGISNVGGELLATGTSLRDNQADLGGGLYNEDGTSTLIGGVVVGNTATAGAGGGIYEASGSVNIAGTLVRSNSPDNCAPPGSVPFCRG
ncbi:hypothetical protein [Streptomyces sp. 7N604]|uniref:hypothetical protein n=1 Tax=Streptomyces sp. 7N604 TaxID=3457415 RepID=UPI003FD44FA2